MNDTPRKETGNYKRSALIALVVFISYAYFYQAGGWNQNSRFDLLRAILDQHTLRIDAYHSNTKDKALFQGHYYSDKAPGVVLLAIPAVAALRPLLRWAGVDPRSPSVPRLRRAGAPFSVFRSPRPLWVEATGSISRIGL